MTSPSPIQTILLFTSGDMPESALREASARWPEAEIGILSTKSGVPAAPLPTNVRCRCVGEYADREAFRRDCLAFLDAWPRRTIWQGRCFDDLFRRPGGYSAWWVGPGNDRHPMFGPPGGLWDLWVFDRALRALAPKRVLLYVQQSALAWSLASRCRRAGIGCEFLAGSAQPRSPWEGRLGWFVRALGQSLARPWLILAQALFARWLAGVPRESPSVRATPAVVFASNFLRQFRVEPDRVEQHYWREITETLGRRSPNLRQRFLPRVAGKLRGFSWVAGLYHTAWRRIRNLEGALPLPECFPAWGAQFRSLPGGLAALVRWFRCEGSPELRESFMFSGADVSSFYAPAFRKTIAGLGGWAQRVAATESSLRAAGNVKALLVSEEMYPPGMIEIAAARRLGIPTVGVQHGTVFPMHLIYTLPPGQVEGAPTPDYFAAYGEFAKETMSVCGAFPADRIWVTGGTRFDHLVNDPTDRDTARRRLELPQDSRIVFVAATLFQEFEEPVRVILETLGRDPGVLVCVKTHPQHDLIERFRAMADQAGATNVRYFREHFDDLLAACDVMVSSSSTTILEAAVFGRPTISVNFIRNEDWYPYVADGASLGAHTPAELRDALRRILSSDEQNELDVRRRCFLARHAGPAAEGRAAETFAERVLALVAGKSVREEVPQGKGHLEEAARA